MTLTPSLFGALFLSVFLLAVPAQAADPLIPNPDFETDADGDGWPDHWAEVKTGGSWEREGENRFLRLSSPEPDSTIMLYQEVRLPDEVKAIEMTWKQRVTGLERGKNSWFDARIMMEFLDADRKKVTPSPPTPNSGKDTDGWVEKQVTFLVPENAHTLKFMPSLLQVKAGTFDLDDLVLKSVDPQPLIEAAETKKREALAKKHASGAKQLAEHGSLIPGWDHEGRYAGKKQIAEEDGNHYLKLVSSEPGKMVTDYRLVDLPADVKALELSWKQRVTGLKKGEKPWNDARIMLEWKDVWGKKVSGSPSPPYTQKDTDGWVEKTKSFLVPEDAATLVFMPTLFNVAAGTYELDDFMLKPVDPAPLLAAKSERDRQIEARHVPDEEPDQSKWPQMLKVAGNKVLDADGNEFWLQGVNAGGLETLPFDQQVVKSVVVAIDDWNANCIRLPVVESFWWGESAYQEDKGEGYRKLIDKIVTLAANRGAYVAIDLHRYRAPKPIHADFWKECAEVYKDHPAVLFDIYNEPHGISWEVWQKGGFVGTKKDADEAAFLSDEEKKKNQGFESVGMQGLVDAVRSTGAKNIIIAGGTFYCNNLSGIVEGYALDDKGGNGIMYSWHNYWWHTGWEKILPVAEKHPIFLGEVGADIKKMSFIPAENQEDPYTWVPDMLGFIQKYHLHWTGWCFHTSASPRMLLDWDYTPTPFWGAFAKEALNGKQFELEKMR